MSSLPVKIGIYCPGTGTGGPWRYVHALLRGVDPDEFDVTVFCDLPSVYEPRPEVKVVRLSPSLGSLNSNEPAKAGANRQRLTKKVRRLLPSVARLWSGTYRDAQPLASRFRVVPVDLLHTQTTGCEESPLAARMAGVPRVLGTFHVDSTYDLENLRSGLGHRAVEFVSNRCLHKAIGVSEATGRDWVRRTRLPASRVVTIHNGIDADQFRRRLERSAARRQLGLPDDERIIIGGVGRLDPAKGFEYLIDAVRILSNSYPNLTLAIAGTGPLRESLEQQAVKAGLSDRVRFLGFQSDVRLVYDALDIAVLSSLCEALPYALLEAMAHELPVVTTTVGGMPEVVVPGETGFLVPPRDAQSLAESLRPLIHSAELSARFGAAGRERVVKHFSEEDCVRKTLNVYRDMLSGLGQKTRRVAVHT